MDESQHEGFGIEDATFALQRYQKFAETVQRLSAAGDSNTTVSRLKEAIEHDKLNDNALGCLMSGFWFNSFIDEPDLDKINWWTHKTPE